jgi:preprotein translocase subunit SecD
MHRQNENRQALLSCSMICSILVISLAVLLTGCVKNTWTDFEGGNHLVFEIESTGDAKADKANLAKTIEMLEGRLQALGLRNSMVAELRERQLIVQLPRVGNLNDVIEKLSRSYSLEFRIVRSDLPGIKEMPKKVSPDQKQSVAEKFAKRIPSDCQILFQDTWDKKTKHILYSQPVALEKRAALGGRNVAEARVKIDGPSSEPYLVLRFDSEGTSSLAEITDHNVGRRLAIVFDGSVYSLPIIRERIGWGEARLSGNLSQVEVKELAMALNYHYPVKFKLVASKGLTKELWLGNEKK